MKEIEFKDMIGRELDVTIIFRKKVVGAWALAGYTASSYHPDHQTCLDHDILLGKWELSIFEASLNNSYLTTNLSGIAFIRHWGQVSYRICCAS